MIELYTPALSMLESFQSSLDAPPMVPDENEDWRWTTCADFIAYTNTNAGSNTQRRRFIFVSLFVLSIMGLLFVAMTIFTTKKLQAHP